MTRPRVTDWVRQRSLLDPVPPEPPPDRRRPPSRQIYGHPHAPNIYFIDHKTAPKMLILTDRSSASTVSAADLLHHLINKAR